MNASSKTIVIAAAMALSTVVGCEEPYHRKQAQAASAAIQRMGGGGVRYILAQTPEGARQQIEINFRDDHEIDDSSLENLAGLDGIVGLDLSGTRITDAGLRTLAELPRLEYLQLANTEIGDAGIRTLAESETLAKLDISGTRVSVDAVPDLERMTALEVVYSRSTPIEVVDGVEVNSTEALGPFWTPE